MMAKVAQELVARFDAVPSPLAGFMLVLHTNSISSLGTNHMNTAS